MPLPLESLQHRTSTRDVGQELEHAETTSERREDAKWLHSRRRQVRLPIPSCHTSTTLTTPSRPKRPPTQSPPFTLDTIIAFYVLLASHTLAAFTQPIQDCDEVFNYWEPTHYLNHAHGFQTWEYSPDFAIRSWAYAGLHAAAIQVAKYAPLLATVVARGGKKAEFYFLRVALGFVCAVCGARLYGRIKDVVNERVAMYFLLIMTTAPGMFHASVSYLPSSFAMYMAMLVAAAFMDWRGGLRTAQGIMFIAVGACIGWPFAAAISIPFLVEEFFLATLSDNQGRLDFVWRILDGAGRGLAVLLLQVLIDTVLYKKLALVPLNIVLYNVFSSNGPDLYGTEPWHFYLRNLALNFHVWLPLALISMPLLLLHQTLSSSRQTSNSTKNPLSHLRGLIFLTPFYLWLTIFTLQPHKEERFMYPAYPFLAYNAAISFHVLLSAIGSPKLNGIIPIKLRLFAILAFVVLSIDLSAFRTLGSVTAYGAPLSIYNPLHHPGMAREGDTVCLGKEWYRFPSHYLLPTGVRAKFIKSEFSGLLPGEFSEAKQGFGMFPGTWLIPPGMNDENREDLGKYTDVRRCDFLVDSRLPSTETTALEPGFVDDEENWERVKCLPFLDAASTGVIGRLGWVPDLPFIPEPYRRVWGEYCLLKRRKT